MCELKSGMYPNIYEEKNLCPPAPSILTPWVSAGKSVLYTLHILSHAHTEK